MKILLVVFAIFAFLSVGVRGECSSGSTTEEIIAASSEFTTAMATECADPANWKCGEGSCWQAIQGFWSWYEGCLSQITSLDLSYLQDAVKAQEELVCQALEDLEDLIASTFTCLSDAGKSQELQNAALKVYEKCSAEATNELCSKECREATISYSKILLQCYDDPNSSDAIQSIRGQLESFCLLEQPSVACRQVASVNALDVYEECSRAVYSDEVSCDGDCFAAIESLRDEASEHCEGFGEELVEGWVKLCSECGQDAYHAFLVAQEACNDVDWDSLDSCPQECSDAVDAAKEAAECFPTNNIIKRVTNTIYRLKEAACDNLSAGSICLLREYHGDWDDLVSACRQDGVCSYECYDELQDFAETRKECFDGTPSTSNVGDSLKNLQSFCADGNSDYILHFLLDNMSVEQIRRSVQDFLTRVSSATGIPVNELFLIFVDEYQGASKRADGSSVTVGSNQKPKSSNYAEYGLDGQVETIDTGSDNGSAATLVFSALFASFAVIASLLF